ncbi:MAG: hypothetical protein PHY31_00310 [Smithellaceae bacterium]|nr:hypothetical protein [Smithellaceae bacterium]
MHKTLFVIILISCVSILAGNSWALGVSQAAPPPRSSTRTSFLENSKSRNKTTPTAIVNPEELDLGLLESGGILSGEYHVKGPGWSFEGPTGWNIVGEQKMNGGTEGGYDKLRLQLEFQQPNKDKNETSDQFYYTVELILEGGGRSYTFRNEFRPGTYRESLKFNSYGTARWLYFNFTVAPAEKEPHLIMDPPILDLGVVGVGEDVSKRVKICNAGKAPLKWQLSLPPKGTNGGMELLPVRYASLDNEESKTTGTYAVPAAYKEVVELSGHWLERDGEPMGTLANDSLRFQFTGTGAIIYLWKEPGGGTVALYIDDTLVGQYELETEQKERAELSVAGNLPFGPHSVGIVVRKGRVILEGIGVEGVSLLNLPAGSLTIFPDSGTTTAETDYVNITVNSRQMLPGSYGEVINVHSNGGDIPLAVSMDVSASNLPRIIDIYRFRRGFDYLYTASLADEARRLQSMGFVKEGIAFHLFSPGTPGTTAFFRWYSPEKRDRYYTHVNSGVRSILKGYILEGTIGNIATSRLTGTRELYRWYNPYTGCHFYTTDLKGEGISKQRYRFDGIAGYVR